MSGSEGEEFRSIPVIVEVELQDAGEWSTVEQAEMNVQRALSMAYPGAPVKVVTATMLPAPMGEALARVMEGGPEAMVSQLNEMAADPEMIAFMSGMMQMIADTVRVPGQERAPDDLSELDSSD